MFEDMIGNSGHILWHILSTKIIIEIQSFGLKNSQDTWQMLSAKEQIHQHFFATFFMMNLDTCIRENKSAVKYNFRTTSLESYLDATTPNDWYDEDGLVVDKDKIMNQHLKTQN